MSLVRRFAIEVRAARLAAGVSQATVARSIGVAKSTVSRLEAGRPPLPNFVTAARMARVVGLDLSIRCFPAAGQLRDSAHVALMSRLVQRTSPAIDCAFETPVRPGDPRAWDIHLRSGSRTAGVAAETRIRDLQALLRREHLKRAEGRVDHLLLLVANTKHNRQVVREAGPILAKAMPLRTRAVLAALKRGELPPADGLVLL
ncbi:MAG TPA: helix-turn-helix transcriptional regulator [Candidatus Limnocylindria bacterium]|nr:helix-turn-helix transcriptional regulator [Candidatus Limnocylindria bacterium]